MNTNGPAKRYDLLTPLELSAEPCRVGPRRHAGRSHPRDKMLSNGTVPSLPFRKDKNRIRKSGNSPLDCGPTCVSNQSDGGRCRRGSPNKDAVPCWTDRGACNKAMGELINGPAHRDHETGAP
jgi:hypothetical protein